MEPKRFSSEPKCLVQFRIGLVPFRFGLVLFRIETVPFRFCFVSVWFVSASVQLYWSTCWSVFEGCLLDVQALGFFCVSPEFVGVYFSSLGERGWGF